MALVSNSRLLSLRDSFKLLIRCSGNVRYLATEAAKSESEKLDEPIEVLPEYEESLEQQKEFAELVEKKRNVSRFSTERAENRHREILPEYIDPTLLKEQRYFRKAFAMYGKSTGVDAGVCWPTKSQLKAIIDDEKVYDLTLEQKIQKFVEKQRQVLESYTQDYEKTQATVQKLPKMVEDYYAKLAKKDKAEEEKAKRNEELLEYVRDHYGYDVDPNDPRVKETIKKLAEKKKGEQKGKKGKK